jgi:uncharacterized membrane protein YqiK
MSYRTPQARGRVEVGHKAAADPVLAQASLDASEILLGYVRRTAKQAYLRAKLSDYGPGAYNEVARRRLELRRMGKTPSQALYDAMRHVIANFYAAQGAQAYRKAAGLGGFKSTLKSLTRTAACATADVTSSLAQREAVRTGGAAATRALDCGREQRRDALQLAEAQAAEAQAMADKARQEAEAQARGDKRRTMYIVGGSVAVLALVGGLVFVARS